MMVELLLKMLFLVVILKFSVKIRINCVKWKSTFTKLCRRMSIVDGDYSAWLKCRWRGEFAVPLK